MGACQGINVFAPANQRSAAPPLRTSLYPWFCMKRGGGSEPPGRLGGGGGPGGGTGSHWEAFVSPLPATGHTRLLEEVGKQHCCYVLFFFFFKVDVGLGLGEAGGERSKNGFPPIPTPFASVPGDGGAARLRGASDVQTGHVRGAPKNGAPQTGPAAAPFPGRPLPAAAGKLSSHRSAQEEAVPFSWPYTGPCALPAAPYNAKPFPSALEEGGCPVQQRVPQMSSQQNTMRGMDPLCRAPGSAPSLCCPRARSGPAA